MRKWNICSIVVILIVLTTNKVAAQKVTLLKTTLLSSYPSASGIVYDEGLLFIMGDDATQLLVLNTDHVPVDSTSIFQHKEKRIHYSIKPDLEALTITTYKGQRYIIALPSFSSETRTKLYVFPVNNIRNYTVLEQSSIRGKIKKIGIQESNLEGFTTVNNYLVASNRANLANPNNYLLTIPAKKRLIKKQKHWKKMVIQLPKTEGTIGVSGLEYFAETDRLYFTASTEATSSANADGAIGESYLGYISNFSSKNKNSTITPDKLINLSKELHIGNQKIEGVCVESKKSQTTLLHLVADNDDGQSIIYKVQLDF